MSDERNEAEPIELGYIEDLGDMISVQEGSTVSRTVMQKAGGNVVLSIRPRCRCSCRR